MATFSALKAHAFFCPLTLALLLLLHLLLYLKPIYLFLYPTNPSCFVSFHYFPRPSSILRHFLSFLLSLSYSSSFFFFCLTVSISFVFYFIIASSILHAFTSYLLPLQLLVLLRLVYFHFPLLFFSTFSFQLVSAP